MGSHWLVLSALQLFVFGFVLGFLKKEPSTSLVYVADTIIQASCLFHIFQISKRKATTESLHFRTLSQSSLGTETVSYLLHILSMAICPREQEKKIPKSGSAEMMSSEVMIFPNISNH